MIPYQFLIFIAVVQSIIFLIHYLVYVSLVRFFGIADPRFILALKITLGILSLTFLAASFASARFDGPLARIWYTSAASWLGFLYFLFLASVITLVIVLMAKVFGINNNEKIIASFFFGMAVMLGIYGLFNASRIRVTSVSVNIPGIPDSWRGKTAVWVSDVHLGHVHNLGFAEKISDMVNNENPDMVFLGGDIFDGVVVDTQKVIKPFSQMQAPDGVYFITGNHEEFSRDNKELFTSTVKNAGIRWLDNEKIEVDGVQIIGVDYENTVQKGQYTAVLEKMGIDKNKPSILLRHVPDNLEIAQKSGVKAQFSGHSHQGQVFLFRFITHFVYKGYDYGLKPFENMQVLTSSGAGTWGPPMRIDTKAEIVKITFI